MTTAKVGSVQCARIVFTINNHKGVETNFLSLTEHMTVHCVQDLSCFSVPQHIYQITQWLHKGLMLIL